MKRIWSEECDEKRNQMLKSENNKKSKTKNKWKMWKKKQMNKSEKNSTKKSKKKN